MLLSPGHSPREISPPPASEKTLTLDPSTSPSSSANATSQPPGNPRKRRPCVLDEDTYVAAIEKIIEFERDFFPDIPKLRDRLDWLEAVRSGDPVLIRDAQLKILERRATAGAGKTPSAAPDITVTGNRSRTPGSTFFPAPSATPFGSDQTPAVHLAHPDQTTSDDPDADVDASLALDEFFHRCTSEDNDSFSKIMEKVNRKKRERYAYLLEGEKETVKALEDEKRDRITDGYGTSGQPASTLEGWNYTAKNLLMYDPADRGEVALTEEERAVRLKGLTKEISHTNTRFHGKLVADSKPTKEEEAVAILYTPIPGTTPAD